MSKRKFARLLIVLFVPLLVLGIVVGKIIFYKSGMNLTHIECISGLCHATQSYSENTFTIYEYRPEKKPFHNWAKSSNMRIDVKIVNVSPFANTGSEATPFMKSLAGREAVMEFGNLNNKEQSIVSKEMVFLSCNGLSIRGYQKLKKGEYETQCFGEGWNGIVIFQELRASPFGLDRLLVSANKAADSMYMEYDLYRIVMYPLFIYLFLLISAFYWIFVKASTFVKNG